MLICLQRPTGLTVSLQILFHRAWHFDDYHRCHSIHHFDQNRAYRYPSNYSDILSRCGACGTQMCVLNKNEKVQAQELSYTLGNAETRFSIASIR